jgi:hypothetical protein
MKQSREIEQEFWSQTGVTRASEKRFLIPVYRVGEVFRQGRKAWPEGGQFTYSRGGFELTLFVADIRADVVNEVHAGEVEFALIVELPLIVLMYRFGQSIPWNDVPYSWHLQPVSCRVVPSVDNSVESRALLCLTLVGADDGIIHAQRGVTLSPRFTHSLQRAIRAQAMMAFNPEDCTSAISKVFLDYSTAVDRLALAEARTMGNE